MRPTSNKESVVKGEVSVLAIVETLVAITLVTYLSAHLNTFRWLAVAMCVAPLLLLRTDESIQSGIKWWDMVCKFALKQDTHFLRSLPEIVAFLFGPIVVRLGATM